MEQHEIIFGRNPVFEYIKQSSNNNGLVLYISESAHGKIINTIRSLAKEKQIRTEICSKNEIQKFEASSRHQGVVLTVSNFERNESKISINEFLENTATAKGVIVLLDQIEDPHNLGSIIRSAEALGANGVIITESHSAQITATVKKTSAGATAYLPVFTVKNAANFIDTAKTYGYWIIGSSEEGITDSQKLHEMKPGVIIIGNENKGIRRLTHDKCDFIFRIPLKGKISSLNASVAAGIIIYEFLKE